MKTLYRMPIRRSTSIFALLFASGPAAVFWAIVAIVVDAVDGQTFRFRPHVGVEVFKRFKPSGAYLNAAPTPVFIVSIIRVIAAFVHVAPSVVFRCMRHAVRSKFLFHFSAAALATARFRQAALDTFYNNVNDISTLASKVCKEAFSGFGFADKSAHWFAYHFHNGKCTTTGFGM